MSSSKGSSRSRRKVSHEDEDTNDSSTKNKRNEESKKKKSGPGVISSSSDPYEILNLSRNATSAQIKSAYRKLALKYHPDKQSSDDEKKRCSEIFTRIGNAYEVLSDENRKREFDLYGRMENDPSNVPSRDARQHHASTSGFHNGFHHHQQQHFGEDPFESFFFNRRPAGFRDPFELFRQVFQDHEDFFSDSFHHPGSTRQHQQQQQQQRNDMFPPDPFMNDPFFSSPFGSMGGGGSMFGGGLFGGGGGLASSMSRQMHLMNSMHQNMHHGGPSSMHQSSFSSSGSASSGAMRESVSTSTRIINGKRQTVTKRTIMRPDGSVETHTETSGDDDYGGGMLGNGFFDNNHDRHLLSDQQQSLRPSRKNSQKKRRM